MSAVLRHYQERELRLMRAGAPKYMWLSLSKLCWKLMEKKWKN